MRTQTEGAATEAPSDLYDFARMNVHLVGIGGSGMSGAAAILLRMGARVSGSDAMPFAGMGALVERGARVSIGHRPENLGIGVDLVVISAAVPESNVELAAARGDGIRVFQYAQFAAALMSRFEHGVAIAGTHGKSTTTAMCAHVFSQAGRDPSFLFGAQSEQLGGGAGLGNGRHFLLEACEFNRSFLHLSPKSAAILNVESDHLDCYSGIDEIVTAFGRFAANVDPGGLLVCNGDDDRAREAASFAAARVETFGFGDRADWRAVNLKSDRGAYAFDVTLRGATLLTTRLSLSGRHNVANALAAAALAHHAGIDADRIADGLSGFRGVSRRMTWRGEGRGVTIVDDYAHHPTEIRVTIEAARSRYRPKRTWVIFQPHQHSRTRHLMDEFAESFADVDEVIVPDVYGARGGGEAQEQPAAARLVARICENGGRAQYLPGLDNVAEHVARHVAEGDLVLTMGAGDVWKVADELVARICEPNRV